MAASTKEATLGEAAQGALDYLTLLYNRGDIDGQVGGEVMSQLASALEGSKTNLADANQNDPALSSQSLSLSEAREEIERLRRELAEQAEATAFADENRTFQIERAEKAEATAKDLRRLLKINNDPPKPGFHCACAYHMQTAEQVQECGAHADLRARAEKAECEWDAALKSARFWEERHYAHMDAISAAIGSTRFMNPPDGGDVSLADQVRRMRAELEAKEARLAALENGPAVLADAHTNPPLSDLSSLRKGAEDAVKPLEWDTKTGGCTATGAGINYAMGEEEPGLFCLFHPFHSDPMPKAQVQALAQSDYETRIRSALVQESDR